ncbi:uncharacterized protein LOC134277801 [Saccostrea cucullata]|uniref:uncharacterized protein LOC134277801 n=1 Tax=Saccostrea cuccullata TaxID=36930 RepID=UPI002ED5C93A
MVVAWRIETLYISDWFDVTVNGTSPFQINHYLNEMPAKVDVQVKVVHGGQSYIFPGIGSTQRDDDIASEYGGVASLYDSQHVKLFVPVAKKFTNGFGRIITTGGGSYSGPFHGTFVTGKVRIRVWKLSELPTPIFSITSGLSISTGSPYQQVTACFGANPDLVIVQLVFNDGYVTEGTGVTPVTADDTHTNHICGVIFGVNQDSITLWAPSKNDDWVACYYDGWGSENLRYSSAAIIVRAWSFSEVYEVDSFPYNWAEYLSGIFPAPYPIDLDYHFVSVEVKSLSVTNGRMFYGAGSASVGNSSESLGGIVYGYTESEILLWTPTSTNSHLIYIDGVWGDGSDNLQEDSVQITIKIINADISECAPPSDITNTVKVYNGLRRGSLTSYSCLEGFVSNGGLSVTSCNGTHWLETNMTCSISTAVPDPPTIANADILVSGNIAQYACRTGFYADMGENIILYNGAAGWTSTNLECKQGDS